jgi:hypothetical protein
MTGSRVQLSGFSVGGISTGADTIDTEALLQGFPFTHLPPRTLQIIASQYDFFSQSSAAIILLNGAFIATALPE